MSQSEASVGKSITSQGVVGSAHPLYQAVASAVDTEVSAIAGRRAEAKSAGRCSVVTVALQGEELSTLSAAFPEFNLLNYASERPAHAWYVQYRRLANEWVSMMAEKVSTSVRHYGGLATPYVLENRDDVQLVSDVLDPVAVHDKYASSMDVYRLFQRLPALVRDTGRDIRRDWYQKFLEKKGVRYMTEAGLDSCTADALCIDGCVSSMSPVQVASAMMRAEAQVAFGFFIYTPSMLFESEGELAGTGVCYSRTENGVRFKYPEGVSGITAYYGSTWDAWTTSHVVEAGCGDSRRFFQLELLKNRGHLMFYRMTALPEEPEEKLATHALDLPDAGDNYLLTTWELKKAHLNPARAGNWQRVEFVASRRLVERTYQFAMQLDKKEFTRYAVRKQVQVVNDRVVVEGTSVKVNSPLGVRYVTRVSNAVYTRAFVDRYETGELMKEAVSKTKVMMALDNASTPGRFALLTWLCATTAWDYTAGALLAGLGSIADIARDAMDFSPGGILNDRRMQQQPSYVLVRDRMQTSRAARAVTMATVAHQCDRLAALTAAGHEAKLVRVWGRIWQSASSAVENCYEVTETVLKFAVRPSSDEADEVFSQLREVNEVDEAPVSRQELDVIVAKRVAVDERVDFDHDPDPVWTLNSFYGKVFPGVSVQNLEYDTASLAFDPQDRVLCAPYLKLPLGFGDGPKSRPYYHGRVEALNVPKRQNTMQELLSSIAARNLNAPVVSLPQDDHLTAKAVWENFLDTMCVPEARERLLEFQRDPASVSEEAYRDWVSQSTPDKLAAVRQELEKNSRSLAEMDVSDYLVMLKADNKPSLSLKPLDSRTEPQVIVYHDKYTSALYSSMFRVIARRFLALLKPNVHVNLLKDTKDIEAFLQQVHPFGEKLQYLENDFSKYDKSQGRFVFILEELVFRALGLNEEMLQRWVGGHVECKLRAVALGLSLHVNYQRKSGDATTALGNVMLNAMSVAYAYRGSVMRWALLMGDDSLVACAQVACREDAVQLLAEVFNLGAKNYITNAPYFASNFVIVDDVNRRVSLVGDPVKRVERWSGMIPADDPQWEERWKSALDSMRNYLSCAKVCGYERRVAERYALEAGDVVGVADAIATALSSLSAFRNLWHALPEMSEY